MSSPFKSLAAVRCFVFALSFAAPNARADSMAESGEVISGIDAITILGTTYDVTFVYTTGPGPSPTFTSAADATTAVIDIDGDLNSLASFPNSIAQLGATFFLVPYPGGRDAVGECILFPTD